MPAVVANLFVAKKTYVDRDPKWIGGELGLLAGIPFGLPGMIAGAAGGYKAGAQYEAGQDAKSAAEQNARAAREMAALRETQQRDQDRATIGRARAGLGMSAVKYGGSALQVLAQSARQAELNALIIRRGGELTAEAELLAGNQAKRAATTQAIGTIIQAGGSIYNNRKPKSLLE